MTSIVLGLLEFWQVTVQLEGLGVRERIDVLHLPAMNDVADGKLRDLPADRARDVRDLHDLLRHMMRARVRANVRPNPVTKGFVQNESVAQPHEENDAH